MGIKIKALIARKLPGDESVTWVDPKVLKKQQRAAEEAAQAQAPKEQ
jgi:tRNA (guanine-N7-)-methyltransferase